MTRLKHSAPSEAASLLATELRTVFRRLKQRLREHGGHSHLTAAQTSVVLRLEQHGPATVSSLARMEGMRPQSMSAVVAPLEELGWVRGKPDPSDGRQTLISLTPRCAKLLEEGRAARQDWLAARIAEKLSAQEQADLRAALSLLIRLVED